MEMSFIKKLSTIGVSEFVLVFLLVLALGGVFALSSSNVNLQLAILPPPPPVITSIFGDPQTHAVLVIGKSSLPKTVVRVYVFSQPLLMETTSDENGAFLAAFTANDMAAGPHEFSAITVLNTTQTTDPSKRVAVLVNDDYSIEQTAGSEIPTVKIGNADAATSELLRAIIRNQEAAKQPLASELPKKNNTSDRTRWIELALLVVVSTETVMLLFERAHRKTKNGRSFFHLGRGFHQLPHSPPISTGRPPGP